MPFFRTPLPIYKCDYFAYKLNLWVKHHKINRFSRMENAQKSLVYEIERFEITLNNGVLEISNRCIS